MLHLALASRLMTCTTTPTPVSMRAQSVGGEPLGGLGTLFRTSDLRMPSMEMGLRLSCEKVTDADGPKGRSNGGVLNDNPMT